jgi:hypothetical protein
MFVVEMYPLFEFRGQFTVEVGCRWHILRGGLLSCRFLTRFIQFHFRQLLRKRCSHTKCESESEREREGEREREREYKEWEARVERRVRLIEW